MNEKALKVLEYHKIIEMLIGHAHSPLGKVKCQNLLPMTNLQDIRIAQTETTDAVSRIRMKGSIHFSAAKDIYASFKRLEFGSTLGMVELLQIAQLLSNTLRAKQYGHHIETEYEPDSLEGYFAILDPLSSMEKEISRCIISEDTMSDHASPELSKLRKQQKNILARMHNELNSILNAHKEYLMDHVITMRNGNYCLPIKSEYKNRIQGVIHDQSSTGSTVFIEPIAIIRMNNTLRELEIQEKREIEFILQNLSYMIAPYTQILSTNLETLAHLDFVYAKASLSRHMSGIAPIFNAQKYIHIKDGRHPLLDPKKVVPIHISLGKEYHLLVVTGPNTGGKTVSLKTVGLFTLMGQSGLHIPAFDGSELSVFTEVFADIGDEQSIEQSLSTFSGHMTKIVEILKKADANSLCLFDELGAGTDPTEGAALAIAILRFLHRMQTRTMATTHYSELKVFALTQPGVENASCEFDIETLRPTYRILIGIPGKSNAFAISKKLGLSEHIIEEASQLIHKEEKSFEDVLAKIEVDRKVIEKERLEVEKYKREAERLKEYYQKQNEKLEKQREKLIAQAKQQAEEILSDAKHTADTTIKNINKIASGAGLGSALEKERDTLRNSLKSLENPIKKINIPKSKTSKPVKLKIGDNVYIHSMNMNGTVVGLPNDRGNLFVQMGILRSQVRLSDISLIDEKPEEMPRSRHSNPLRSSALMKSASISPEINLIGMKVDEACAELEKYLDDALLSHLSSVRIIHGRGTGALQKGIHNFLKHQKFIKSFRLAEFEDGGDAITIVKFK